ncbi:alcohol-forming fatty acyl-CoA reductase-like [Gossypium australe]|uniref:Alcohol-forming fatty acyl-CoA reductase-like n=1 Tax=Gossypium australe TaxID=47621 RepID=A0A5B6WR00_9ROSI|nr:alcohol-forming fatty acyl-CoA reductase-like [Gossypium australe]
MIDLRAMFAKSILYEDGGLLVELQVEPTLVNEIKIKIKRPLGEKDLRQSILRKAHSSLTLCILEIFEVVGRSTCRYQCWTELGEKKMLGQELVQETEGFVKLIQGKLKATLDQQNSNVDLKRKDTEFKRYRSNPSHVVPIEEIEVRPNLSFEEEPVQILALEVKVQRKKRIPLVKVFVAKLWH